MKVTTQITDGVIDKLEKRLQYLEHIFMSDSNSEETEKAREEYYRIGNKLDDILSKIK